jgi:hypothetical protein
MVIRVAAIMRSQIAVGISSVVFKRATVLLSESYCTELAFAILRWMSRYRWEQLLLLHHQPIDLCLLLCLFLSFRPLYRPLDTMWYNPIQSKSKSKSKSSRQHDCYVEIVRYLILNKAIVNHSDNVSIFTEIEYYSLIYVNSP